MTLKGVSRSSQPQTWGGPKNPKLGANVSHDIQQRIFLNIHINSWQFVQYWINSFKYKINIFNNYLPAKRIAIEAILVLHIILSADMGSNTQHSLSTPVSNK